MKTKIFAIILVLCLGLMLIQIPENNVVAIKQNYFLLSSGENATMDEQYPNATNIGIYIKNNAGQSRNGLFWFPTNQIHPNSIIIEAKLRMYVDTANTMNVSIYGVVDHWINVNVTWNTRANITGESNRTWENPGGDFDYFSIDTLCVVQGTWIEYNITTIYKDWVNNGSKNFGLIFIADIDPPSGNLALLVGNWGSNKARLNLTYSEPNDPITTNLLKDVWNLEGFANTTSKLASAIYSEITNITAISWKNATTGYWYTYWPSLGLTEDAYLEFGDGLFILTDQDTTWDHT